MSMNREKRKGRLFELLKDRDVPFCYITQPEDIYYFSGFTGEGALILSKQHEDILLTDFRYEEQAANQTKGFQIVSASQIHTILTETLTRLAVKVLGIQDKALTLCAYRHLEENKGITFVSIGSLCDEIRSIKDDAEMCQLLQAIKLTDDIFSDIIKWIKPGVTEKAVSAELIYRMRKAGADGESFPSIVASGPHASLPHAISTNKVIEKGDVLLMDFGVKQNGYCADMTRTVAIGKWPTQMLEIYGLVLKAQQLAQASLKAGCEGSFIDKIARDYLKSQGHGEHFGHGLGHGVGLMIHELPRLSPLYHGILQSGMVVTVEPGVYLQGVGGIRIEDICWVEKNGCKVLTESVKTPLVL